MAHSAAPHSTIARFSFTERGLHWTHALFFLILLVTGLVMLVPGLSLAVGHHFLILRIHLITAAFYAGGPLLWFLFGNRRALRADLGELDRWYADDFRWLRPRRPGAPVPPQGRFNAGQKINAIFVGASTIGFVVTGFIMWQNALFPRSLVDNAVHLHDTFTYLALALWLGHVYLAALNRSTRPGLRGMIDGTVDRAWAEHHHPRWVATVEHEHDEEAPQAPAPSARHS
jgi:formate dehydrogenase subunit gamma